MGLFCADSGGIAAGTIAIIVVVSVIMFVVLVALAYFILRRQKQKQIRSNQERRYCKGDFLDEQFHCYTSFMIDSNNSAIN